MKDPLDNLKDIWKSTELNSRQLEEANRQCSRRLASAKAVTLRQRLYRQALRTGCAGIILPMLAPLLYRVLDIPLWYAIAYAIFGLLAGCISFVIAGQIKSCDLASMPVAEVMEKMVANQRLQIVKTLVAAIFGSVLAAILACLVWDSSEPLALASFFAGLALGLSVAIPSTIRRFRSISSIIADLRQKE